MPRVLLKPRRPVRSQSHRRGKRIGGPLVRGNGVLRAGNFRNATLPFLSFDLQLSVCALSVGQPSYDRGNPPHGTNGIFERSDFGGS